jgi:hypothetical protein
MPRCTAGSSDKSQPYLPHDSSSASNLPLGIASLEALSVPPDVSFRRLAAGQPVNRWWACSDHPLPWLICGVLKLACRATHIVWRLFILLPFLQLRLAIDLVRPLRHHTAWSLSVIPLHAAVSQNTAIRKG